MNKQKINRTQTVEIFSTGFKSFLKRTGFSQTELAILCGLSQQHISVFASGRGLPSFEILRSLFNNGLTLEDAFGEDFAKKIKSNATISISPKNRIDDLKNVLEILLKQVSKSTPTDE